VSGSTVTLSWSAPGSGGPPSDYVIEAGLTPGGLEAANFLAGSIATTYSAIVTGTGTYYVRVHAVNAGGTGPPSNEIIVVLGALRPPGQPTGLMHSSNGADVRLTWRAPATGGPVTSYIVEAGSRPGAADLANFNTGSNVPNLAVGRVPSGIYFVRVRAANAVGVSAPSDDEVVVIQ
jgi:Fibronectin type III domain